MIDENEVTIEESEITSELKLGSIFVEKDTGFIYILTGVYEEDQVRKKFVYHLICLSSGRRKNDGFSDPRQFLEHHDLEQLKSGTTLKIVVA